MRDHTVLPATHMFVHASHTCLYSPAAEHHRTLAGTVPIYRLAEGRRLSWLGWNTEVVCSSEDGLPFSTCRRGRESNWRTSSSNSNALTTRLPSRTDTACYNVESRPIWTDAVHLVTGDGLVVAVDERLWRTGSLFEFCRQRLIRRHDISGRRRRVLVVALPQVAKMLSTQRRPHTTREWSTKYVRSHNKGAIYGLEAYLPFIEVWSLISWFCSKSLLLICLEQIVST